MTNRPSLSRRRVIRSGILGLGGLAALPLLAACGGSSAPAAPTTAPASTSGTSSSAGAAATPAAGSSAAPTTSAGASAAPTTSTGSGAAPTAAAAAGAATGPKTQVVFSNSTSAGDPTRVEAWDTLIGQFEKANPNITVGKQYIPDTDYYDKMVAQAATGTMPDVVSSRSDMHITWAANQMLLPLDDLVKGADFNLKDFSTETLKGGQLKDKLYGVARSISAYIMFYNKELYDKNGVAYPDDKMTWNAFLDPAKKLTKDTGSGKVDQWGHIITSDWKMWISLMWENGGDYENADQTMSTINTKEATDLVQYYLDLALKQKVAPSTAELSQTGNQGFLTGRIGTLVALQDYAYLFRTQAKFDFDITYIPAGPVARSTPIQSSLYCISAKTKVKDAAYKLFAYMLGPDAQNYYADRGTFPSRLSVVPRFNQANAGQKPKSIEIVGENFAKYGKFWPVTTNWTQLAKDWQAGMQKAQLGEATVAQVHADLKPKFDKYFQENQKILKSLPN